MLTKKRLRLNNLKTRAALNSIISALVILLHNIWPSPFRSKLEYQSRPARTCEPLQSPSFKRPDVFPRARRVNFFSSIFLKNLFQLTPTLTFDFTVTIISNSSVCNNFYDGRIRFQQERTKHYFPPNENRDNPCKWGKGEGLPCQFILECRARRLEKTPEWKNEGLIILISALINTRLTEFRSEMITLINKNGDQPMSLGDRDSY